MSVIVSLGAQMIELSLSFITGVMVGIEFKYTQPERGFHSYTTVVDLFIVRLVASYHRIDVDA